VIDGNGLQAQAATVLARALPAQAGTAGRKIAGSSPAPKDAAAKPAILSVGRPERVSHLVSAKERAGAGPSKIRNDVRTLEG
jgi:hypothetical protein